MKQTLLLDLCPILLKERQTLKPVLELHYQSEWAGFGDVGGEEPSEIEALLVEEEISKREALLDVFLPLGYDLEAVIYEPAIVRHSPQLPFHVASLFLLLS